MGVVFMLKLMKLELRKFNINRFIRGAIISDLVILALPLLMVLVNDAEVSEAFIDYGSIFLAIGSFSKLTFTIFAAVLISRLIISEYNSKTITVLFTYPVNRKKLILAKLAIIVIFTFISILFSNLVIAAFFIGFNSFYPLIPDSLTSVKAVNFLISSVLDAFAFSGVSLIPLYFGMRKKSVPATIVSSILIASILSSNNYGFSLSSIIAIPLSLAAIGVFIAYLTIRNIEHVDVGN
jgi:ABC-type transport system involved in multi-copper enzyme maturation permease subunit